MIRRTNAPIKVHLACLFASIYVGGAAFGFDDTALRHYHAANGLLQRGHHELAIQEYRDFLRGQPDHDRAPTARYGLAVCLSNLNQCAEAVEAASGLAGLKGFEFAMEAGVLVGRCRLGAGQFDQAITELTQALKGRDAHKLAPEALCLLAEAQYRSGKYGEGVNTCERGMKLIAGADARATRLRLLAGLCAAGQSNFKQAAEFLQPTSLQTDAGEDAASARLLLAQCRQRLGETDEALRLYRALVKEKASTRVEAALGAARLLLDRADAAEAGRMLDEAEMWAANRQLPPAAMVLRGRALLESKEYDRAMQCFEKTPITETTTETERTYWLAKCELRAGRNEEAAKRLNAGMPQDADAPFFAEMQFDRAVALVRAGKNKNAAAALTKVIDKFEKRPLAADAFELLATALHQSGRYTDSDKECDRFLERFKDHRLAPGVSFLRAENAFMKQDYVEATSRFQAFLAQYPTEDRAALAGYRLGLALTATGRNKEAAPFLAAAAALAERDARFRPAALAMANGAFEVGDFDAAVAGYENALRLDPSCPQAAEAILKLGISLERLGKYNEALRRFEEVTHRFSESDHARHAAFEGAQTLRLAGREQDAAKAFETLLDSDPSGRFAAHARRQLAAIVMKAGDARRASGLLKDMTYDGLEPDIAAQAQYELGQALLAAGDHAEAARAFGRFLKDHSDHERAAAARAQQAIATIRAGDASAGLKALESISPDQVPVEMRWIVLYEKACALNAADRRAEAVKAFLEISEHGEAGPLRLHALLELAASDMEAKRFESAAKSLESILNTAGARPTGNVEGQASYRLATCHLELGRFDRAADEFAEFAGKYPDGPQAAQASYYAGECLFRLGKFDAAWKHFDGLMASGPTELQPTILLRAGECLAQMQRWRKSEETYERYLVEFGKEDGRIQAQFGIAWAAENQNRYPEAVDGYRKVVDGSKGPLAARAQFQIGECLFAQKKHAEAARELLKVDILFAYPEWSAAALYEAGRAFTALNKLGEARDQFKTVAEKYQQTKWAGMAQQRLNEIRQEPIPGHAAG